MNVIANVKQKYASYQSLDAKDKKTFWKEALINNALYILLVIAIIYTYTQNHRFLAPLISSAFPPQTCQSPAVLPDVSY